MEPKIILLEGDDLRAFLAAIGSPFTGVSDRPYRLRIWSTNDGQIKVKVNENMWTPRLGKADK